MPRESRGQDATVSDAKYIKLVLQCRDENASCSAKYLDIFILISLLLCAFSLGLS